MKKKYPITFTNDGSVYGVDDDDGVTVYKLGEIHGEDFELPGVPGYSGPVLTASDMLRIVAEMFERLGEGKK